MRGEFYGTPKEVWGFRTARAAGLPEQAARDFLSANSGLFELEENLAGLRRRRVIRSLGANHVIFSQVHAGHRVHRGYVTVHMDRAGRVFLAKNRSVPARLLPPAFRAKVGRDEAVKKARRSLRKRDRESKVSGTERVWFPEGDRLAPAWKMRITRDQPREDWIVFVDADTGRILSRYDNLSEAKDGLGRVFDPNPATALGDYRLLLTGRKRARRPPPVAYREVPLPGLDGSGTLSGDKVTTAPTRATRVRRANLQFLLRSDERGFEEVMVYYHVDAALPLPREPRLPRPARDLPRAGARQRQRHAATTTPGTARPTACSPSAPATSTTPRTPRPSCTSSATRSRTRSAPTSASRRRPRRWARASATTSPRACCESKKPARYGTSVMSWDGLLIGTCEPPRSALPAPRRQQDDLRRLRSAKATSTTTGSSGRRRCGKRGSCSGARRPTASF